MQPECGPLTRLKTWKKSWLFKEELPKCYQRKKMGVRRSITFAEVTYPSVQKASRSGDMIEAFKMLNGFDDKYVLPRLALRKDNVTNQRSIRGHSKQLFVEICTKDVRKYIVFRNM